MTTDRYHPQAQAVSREVPWYGTKTAVKDYQSLDQIAEALPVLFEPVELKPIILGTTEQRPNENGDLEDVTIPTGIVMPDRFVTCRVHRDGTLTPYETVKSRYVPAQDATIMEKALAAVAASHGDAVFDCVATFGHGKQFLAVIDLGALIIDPGGIGDRIDRYLIVRNSHDGTTPITWMNTGIRVRCLNAVPGAEKAAKAVIKARHTLNAESTLDEAAKVLAINTDWAQEFVAMADTMLGLPVSGQVFDAVAETLFPVERADTDLKRQRRTEKVEALRAVYTNPRNAQAVGDNGWGLYNAVVEYLDHEASKPSERHRLQVIEWRSTLNATKRAARDRILALAN